MVSMPPAPKDPREGGWIEGGLSSSFGPWCSCASGVPSTPLRWAKENSPSTVLAFLQIISLLLSLFWRKETSGFFIPRKIQPSIRLQFPSDLTTTVPTRAKTFLKEQNWHIQRPIHSRRGSNPAHHKQSWLQSSASPFHTLLGDTCCPALWT